MKNIFLILGLFFAIDGQAFAANQVCLKEQCITVELAQTDSERTRGLQHRESLDQDKGMLFLFSKSGRYGFWMKDTKIPLDIIWLDQDRKIVHLIENVPPCVKDPCQSYIPGGAALYVLEVNSKTIEQFKWKVGDALDIRLESKETP